jgi:hypothetical protein
MSFFLVEESRTALILKAGKACRFPLSSLHPLFYLPARRKNAKNLRNTIQ